MEIEKKSSKYVLYVKGIKFENGNLYLDVDEDFKNIFNYKIIFIERKTKDEYYIDSKTSNNTLILSLYNFIESYKGILSRWDIYLVTDNKELLRIKIIDSNKYHNHEKYLEAMHLIDSINVMTPYITKKDEISLIINTEQRIFNEQLKETVRTRIKHVSIENNIFSCNFLIETLSQKSFSVDKLILKLRNDAKIVKYDIDTEVRTIKKDKYLISFKINLTKYIWEPFYWDIFVYINLDNKKYYLKIKNPNLKVLKEINNKISKYECLFGNNFMVYPYITKDHALALNYREKNYYENKEYRRKEKFAYYIYLLFKPYFDMKNIWLGYEKFAETAQDNGFYFFDYCYKNNKHKNYYYIIKSNSKDLKNLKGKEDKIIEFMSFKYMLYLYSSKLLIASESKGHCYDIRIQKGNLKKSLDKKKIVFLQHGVIAFKKVDFFKKSKNKMDLFVVSSDFEKQIIKKYFEYKDQEIINTGLCRWDVLEDKSSDGKREIIIMPTWRAWMDGISDEDFIKSNYFKTYNNLLNSENLYKLINDNDIILNFFIHPKFKQYIGNFKSRNKNLNIYEFGQVELNKLLMKASLLVTDYSSVAWDVYYQKKPVIFFQFDIKEYDLYQGSYIDMKNQLFGDRAFNEESLLRLIKEYIATEFKEKPQYEYMRSTYLSNVDKSNCERTYEAIILRNNMLKKSKYDYFLMLKSNIYIKGLWFALSKNARISRVVKKIILKIKK